jgi:hypothetical protein
MRESAGSEYEYRPAKELREYLCVDEPRITKMCRAEGFGWLPRARAAKDVGVHFSVLAGQD